RRSLSQNIRQSQFYKNKTTEHLRDLQSIDEFAQPLLQKALDDEFGSGLDVKHDTLKHVHLINAGTISTPRNEKITYQSLLEAALQNFEMFETLPHGFNTGSAL
ncbi:dermonecrotic toxin domain-containing protein, partial [Pseudomonas agarici]